MYKAKHVLPKSAMLSLYYILAYPYLMYCNEVRGIKIAKTHHNTKENYQNDN